MKHIFKEYKKGNSILVDGVLPSSNTSAGDIVEIHTVDGSVVYKVLVEGFCKDCSQYPSNELNESRSDGCFTTERKGEMFCPTIYVNLVFKDLDNIMEEL